MTGECMFCRTKKVKEMIDGLRDEIEKLKVEVKEAKKEPEISYSEDVGPVYLPRGFPSYLVKEKLPVSKVVEMLLAHSGGSKCQKLKEVEDEKEQR